MKFDESRPDRPLLTQWHCHEKEGPGALCHPVAVRVGALRTGTLYFVGGMAGLSRKRGCAFNVVRNIRRRAVIHNHKLPDEPCPT